MAPAYAVDYGGWNARATLDGWHDDNMARGVAVTTTSLPNGNQDFGAHLGLSFGNVWLLTPVLDTWLIVDGHGSAGLLYPALSDVWGALYSHTVWHLDGGRDAFVLGGATGFWGNGNYLSAQAGMVQPLWIGASARGEAGVGLYTTNVAGSSFSMPSIGGGIDQLLVTGTQLSAHYAFQFQAYDDGHTVPRHQVYLRAGQPVGNGWEVHATYLETIDLSVSSYLEGYLGLGIAYEL
jgi:hypothetical protein